MADNKDKKALNVPALRFPEFSGEWERCALAEICNIVGRIGFRGYTIQDIVDKGTGAIALSPSNITDNRLSYDKDNTYISYFKYEESPEIKVFVGDIVFVKTGSTVGKVAYVDNILCETTLNPQLVVLKKIKCNSFLLGQILSASKFQNAIKRITVGGAVPTLSQNEMGKISVSIPQKMEQKKIATLFHLIDERISVQNKIIEDLKKLKSAIYQEMFGSLVAQTLELGQVAEITKGKQVNGTELLEQGDYYVMNGGTTPSGWLNRYNTEANTISISEGGNSCGYVQYNISRYWSGGHCYSLRILHPQETLDLYLYHFLKWQEDNIMALRIGSGLPNIQKKDLLHFPIILPTIDKQKSIISVLTAIDAKIACEDSLTEYYTMQKDFLLRNLFT